MFNSDSIISKRIILLTGKPRTGKSTIFKRLINNYNSNKLYFVLSREYKENNKRMGFDVCTSDMSNPIAFARRNTQGKYEFMLEVWQDIAKKIAKNKDKIIILDEFGSIQFKNKVFRDTILTILKDKSFNIIATIALLNDDTGAIDNIKNMEDSVCFELTEDNRDEYFLLLSDLLERKLNNVIKEGSR